MIVSGVERTIWRDVEEVARDWTLWMRWSDDSECCDGDDKFRRRLLFMMLLFEALLPRVLVLTRDDDSVSSYLFRNGDLLLIFPTRYFSGSIIFLRCLIFLHDDVDFVVDCVESAYDCELLSKDVAVIPPRSLSL